MRNRYLRCFKFEQEKTVLEANLPEKKTQFSLTFALTVQILHFVQAFSWSYETQLESQNIKTTKNLWLN